MIEDDDERDLVIADGVIADADPVPGTEPDAAGWVLPGLVDVHNHLSLASPAGDDQDSDVRVRASASVELAHGVLAIRELTPAGGDLWSHVWALTQAVPLARHAGDPRAGPWYDEALTTAQRSGMRSLARDLLQLSRPSRCP